jgi:hypothetical protein
MIKARKDAWPHPGDTKLDRARRCAHTYRAELLKVAPDRAAAVDARLTELGEPWVAPQRADVDLDAWVSLDQAAELTGGTRDMIYKWATRDERIHAIKDDRGRLLVQVRQVLDAQAELRIQRAERHAGATELDHSYSDSPS